MNQLKKKELLALCKQHGIVGVSELKKDAILKRLHSAGIFQTQVETQIIVPHDKLTVKHIFHMADIQVRPLSRHEEFIQVFKKLYKELIKQGSKKEGSMIVICGDILQEKDRMKPEVIIVLRDFFRTLTKLCQYVVVIAGNHDLVENNIDRLDNLTPILDDLDVIYLKYSGAYRFGNVVFGVSSVVDHKLIKCNFLKTEPDTTYIALYHGMLSGTLMDNGTLVTRDGFANSQRIKAFDGYDYVLLGDIHKHQYLKRHIAYSGSLVQQNFGEPYRGHGFIKWDLRKGTSNFVEIKSDYGFVNVLVKRGQLVKEIELPKKPYIRYHVAKTTDEQLRVFREKFEENLDVQRVDVRYIVQAINEIPVELTHNLDDTNLLKQELRQVEKDDIDFIVKYHQAAKQELLTEDQANVQYWCVLKLEFKNIMIYGGNKLNVINFTQQGSIISICGDNAIGKSCIQKMLLFALFDKFTHGNTSDKASVLNRDSTDCFLAVEFLYGNKRYRIEKRGKRRKHYGIVTAKFTNDFYKIKSDGTKVSLNAEHGIKTNIDIRNVLGSSYNDFLLTNVYSNTIYLSILGMTETERLDILNKYFRLDWYKQLLDKVKGDIKILERDLQFAKGQLETVNQRSKEVDKSATKAQLNDIRKRLDLLRCSKDKVVEKQQELHEDIKSLNEKIFDVTKQMTVDTGDLIGELEQLQNELQGQDDNKLNKKQILTELSNVRLQVIPGNRSLTEVKAELQEIQINPEKPKLSLEEIERAMYKLEYQSRQHKETMRQYKSLQLLEGTNIEGLKADRIELEKTISANVFIKPMRQVNAEDFDKLKALITRQEKLKNSLIAELRGATVVDGAIKIDTTIRDGLLVVLEEDTSEQKVRWNALEQDIKYNEEIEKDIRVNQENDKKRQRVQQINKTIASLSLHEIAEQQKTLRQYKEYYNQEAKLEQLQLQLEIAEANEKNLAKIQTLESQLDLAEKFERLRLLNSNKMLAKEFRSLKKDLDRKTEKQTATSHKLECISQEIVDLETQHDSLADVWNNRREQKQKKQELSNKIIEIEERLERYRIYSRVVDRNGLPLRLMEKKITELSVEINRFLDGFVKFDIKIETDTSGKRPRLLVYAMKNEIKLNVIDLSGYETFALNLAFKFALNRLSYLGKCSLLCIDEGLDCIDEHNFQRLGDLLGRLRTQYRQILMISHIPEIKKYEDTSIQIVREGKYSRLSA